MEPTRHARLTAELAAAELADDEVREDAAYSRLYDEQSRLLDWGAKIGGEIAALCAGAKIGTARGLVCDRLAALENTMRP